MGEQIQEEDQNTFKQLQFGSVVNHKCCNLGVQNSRIQSFLKNKTDNFFQIKCVFMVFKNHFQDFCFYRCKQVSDLHCISDSFFNVYSCYTILKIFCLYNLQFQFHVVNHSTFKACGMMLSLIDSGYTQDSKLRFVFHGENMPVTASHLLSSKLSIDDWSLHLNA